MIRSVEDLLRAAPRFHRDLGGQVYSAHLNEEGLLFLERQVSPGDRTLETGVGYSTIVFALRGASHTAIAPAEDQVAGIREFCAANGVSLDSVTFVLESSDRALPRLQDDGPLDLVLIDGSHSFPLPFIDWHYTSRRLKVGGHLLIDDVEVWTGRTLRDFLMSETWMEHEADLCVGRTAIFRKTAERPDPDWTRQPYVLRRSDLSLMVTRTNTVRLARVNPIRFARDVAVRGVRTAIAYGRHLRDPSVPPPFRRKTR